MRRLLVFGCCLLPAVSFAAPPDLWVEARLEPPAVPVNVQSTFVLRFGHAVDVRQPKLEAPVQRLAEVRALGGLTRSEATRDGKRYRVLERRFAVLPFASGELSLHSEVTGRTPAAIPEARAGGRFALASAPLVLQVSPAEVRQGASWLPAHNLQITASGELPARFAAGDVWTRQILIEAEGIDGSAIPPLRWPASDSWNFHSADGEVGVRERSGRLIGYRRQIVSAQARHAGSLIFPALAIDWWRVDARAWTRSVLPATGVTVAPGEKPAAAASSPPATVPVRWPASLPMLAAALLLLAGGAYAMRTHWRRGWQRWQRGRVLSAACRSGDVRAARHALLAWASAQGVREGTLEAVERWAARGGDQPLAAAIRSLEAACYGRPPGGWDGGVLQQALRRRRKFGRNRQGRRESE